MEVWSCFRACCQHLGRNPRRECPGAVSSRARAAALQHRLGGLSGPRLMDLWIGGRAASVALRCLAAPTVVVSSANAALVVALVLMRQADGWHLLAARTRSEMLIELLVRFHPSGTAVTRF